MKAKMLSIFFLIITVSFLTGCEVTIKTREYRKEKVSKPAVQSTVKNKPKPKFSYVADTKSKIFSVLGINSKSSKKVEKKYGKEKSNIATLSWGWPVKSTKENHISLKKTPQGMFFLGKAKTPVVAAARGIVVYSGSGIKEYGNLIIIKHIDDMLSVYANNKVLKVKEGETVQKGQEIAKMGDAGKMHFEIRQQGKFLDPLKVLPNKIQQ